MDVGIKPFGIGAFELFKKLGFVAAVQNVVADVIGFREGEDDEIMAVAVGARLRGGGLGFLVPGLAVDDAGDASLEYCRTRFHTLITSPQVVSTNRQPFSSSFLRVATSVPNAGMMTTSSGRNWLISSSLGLPEMIWMPMLRIWSFTSGL